MLNQRHVNKQKDDFSSVLQQNVAPTIVAAILER